jgi:hypothetical protein
MGLVVAGLGVGPRGGVDRSGEPGQGVQRVLVALD